MALSADWLRGMVRVCDRGGDTVGTGFLATKDLVVTCAHVIRYAKTAPHEPVTLVLLENNQPITAMLELNYWRESDREDVAVLRLQAPLPLDVCPLFLGTSTHITGLAISTHGFTADKPLQGIRGTGYVEGELKHENGCSLLQISSSQITVGFSGAPVVSDKTGRVVGMVTEILAPDRYSRGQETVFATPSWVLREICPELTLKDICPYQGLSAFTDREAEFFYGRDNLIAELLEHLRRSPQFLAIVGASGSGKSSAVQAGLLPRLQRGEAGFPEGVPIFRMRPSHAHTPEASLLAAISAQSSDTGSIGTIVQQAFQQQPDRCILLIDQFEELFALFPNQQASFISSLNDLLRSTPHLTLILTIRSDFYAPLQESGLGHFLPAHQVNVRGVLDRVSLTAIIIQPANQVGLQLEEGLDELILTDLRETKNPLPLLEFTLTQLWRLEHEQNRLTCATYVSSAIGRVTGAIARWANDTYNSLSDSEKALTRRIFTRLIHYGSADQPDTRQPQSLEALVQIHSDSNLVRSLIQRLANARLLVADEKTVEIIHDALITEWTTLQGWIEQERPFLSWRDRLQENLKTWQTSQKSEGDLLSGNPLAVAETFLKDHRSDLNAEECRYIEAGLGKRDRQRRRTISSLSIGLISLSVFAGIATWQWKQAEFERVEADRQRIEAELIASSLSSENLFNSNKELESLIEAIKAGKLLQHSAKVKPDTRMRVLLALQQAVYEIREQNRLEVQTNIGAISFSPDGKMFAAHNYKVFKVWDRGGNVLKTLPMPGVPGKFSFSSDSKMIVLPVYPRGGKIGVNNLQIWSIDGVLQKNLKGHDDFVHDIKFSPDNQIIASASRDKTIKIWSKNGSLIRTLRHSNEIRNISFSSTGKIIVSDDGKNINLWNVNDGKLIKILKGHAKQIDWVSFSPNGKIIASYSGEDKNLNFWSSDGFLIKELKIINYSFSSPIFSPDSQSIAAFDLGKTMDVNLWGLDGKLISTFKGNSTLPLQMSFSPDGHRIAAANAIGKITLLSLNKTSPTTIKTPKVRINSMSFSPDSKIIALANSDNNVRLWNRENGSFQTLQGHRDPVKGITFSPNGEMIASVSSGASGGGEVILWSSNGAFLRKFDVTDYDIIHQGHDGPVLAVTFIPKRNVIASSSADGTVRFWNLDGKYGTFIDGLRYNKVPIWSVSFSPDAKTLAVPVVNDIYIHKGIGKEIGKPQNILKGHKALIRRVTFSPDSQIIASASFDNTVKLWNLEGKELNTLNHNNAVGDVDFSPDGKTIATISGDGIKVLDLTGKLLRQFNNNQILDEESFGIGLSSLQLDEKTNDLRVETLADSPAKKAGIQEGDRIIKVNGVDTKGKNLSNVKRLIRGRKGTQVVVEIARQEQQNFSIPIIRENNETYQKTVRFSPDGQIIAAVNNDKIELWTITGKLLKILEGHSDAIFDINFSPSGKVLASASADKTVKLWSIPEGKVIRSLNAHSYVVTSVSFSTDGQFLVSGSGDSVIRVWKIDGTFIKPLLGRVQLTFFRSPTNLSFNFDGTMLALSGGLGSKGQLWSTNGNLIKTLGFHNTRKFLPDGNLKFWSGISNGHKSEVSIMIYSPDGKVVASDSYIPGFSNDSSHETKLWNQDGTFIKDMNGNNHSIVKDLSFSPDSKIIASANLDNALRLWSTDGNLLRTLSADNSPIHSVSFSPIFNSDNYVLASASSDNMVRIWSSNGTLLKSLKGHQCGVVDGGHGCLSFSPDGKTLASVNDDTVILWNLDLDDLLIKGCAWADGYLKNNPNVNEDNRHLCDGIDTQK